MGGREGRDFSFLIGKKGVIKLINVQVAKEPCAGAGAAGRFVSTSFRKRSMGSVDAAAGLGMQLELVGCSRHPYGVGF